MPSATAASSEAGSRRCIVGSTRAMSASRW
jgi:hypothetical protein